MNDNQKCADYLQSKDLHRFMLELKKRWQRYGCFKGIITLKNTSVSERNALRDILGEKYQTEDVTIQVEAFVNALNHSAFQNVDLKEVLNVYFREPVYTFKEIRENTQLSLNTYFSSLEKIVKESVQKEILSVWFQQSLEKKAGAYKLMLNLKKENEGTAIEVFSTVIHGVSLLITGLDKVLPIAVFAANISGNPHYLDKGNAASSLLLYILSYVKGREYPKDAASWYDIFSEFRLNKDELAGSVAVYNVHVKTLEGLHPGVEGCYQCKQPFILSSLHLSGDCKLYTDSHCVYIVENEMVFSYLQNSVKDTDVALICTSGQLSTTASYIVEKLVQSDATIYYSGDLDPEGIGICDRLWQKYPDHVVPWHMTYTDYMQSKSSKEISDSRLSSLNAIENPVLKETSQYLWQEKYAGYQENILEEYEKDMQKYYHPNQESIQKQQDNV